MSPILLYVTLKNKQEALEIARTLLSERLIACANIMPEVISVYMWEDAIQEEAEVILLAKTTPEAKTAAIRRISELHSYDCPCILAFDSTDSHLPFAKWIFSQIGD